MATIRKIQRKNGIVFKAIIKDRQGKAITSKTFTRKTDATAWTKRIEADREVVEALGTKGARMTVKQLIDEYMQNWRGKDPYQINRAIYWSKELGNYRIMDVTADIIRQKLRAFEQGSCIRGNGGKGKATTFARTRKPSTVNRHRTTLSGIFKYAWQQGYIAYNPVAKTQHLKEEQQFIRYLSDTERTALLNACQASEWPKLYALVLLAMTTGMRRGELLKLRWSDIDFANSLAFLKTTKNGEPKVCPIPTPAMIELRRLRELGSGLIFPSDLKPDRPMDFDKQWAKALKIAEVYNFRFHDLRHDFCSQLAMNGATLQDIAQLAGHKDLKTTMRYVHLSISHKQSIAERIMTQVLGR